MKQVPLLNLEEALRQKAVYTSAETSYLCSVSERTLRRHVERGLIKPNKGTRCLRFSASEIQRYLEGTR